MGVEWEWSGSGVRVEWEWSGSGVRVEWEWSGSGVGVEWEWSEGLWGKVVTCGPPYSETTSPLLSSSL